MSKQLLSDGIAKAQAAMENKSPQKSSDDPFDEFSGKINRGLGISATRFYGSNREIRTYSRRRHTQPLSVITDQFTNNSVNAAALTVNAAGGGGLLFKDAAKFIPPYKIGFPNAGLTCYLNSVVQALLGLTWFVSDFDQEEDGEENCRLVSRFCQLAGSKSGGNESEVFEAMRKFRACLGQKMPQFQEGSMQDAHEFLLAFLDAIQQELEKAKLDPVEANFAYKTEGTKTCSLCNHVTKIDSKDLVLKLDMPSSSGLRFTLDHLFHKTMNGSGLVTSCSKCSDDKITSSVHELSERFSHLPRIFIVYLPRTEPYYVDDHSKELKFRKNRTFVKIPESLFVDQMVTRSVNDVKTPCGGDKKAPKRSYSLSVSSSSSESCSSTKAAKNTSNPFLEEDGVFMPNFSFPAKIRPILCDNGNGDDLSMHCDDMLASPKLSPVNIVSGEPRPNVNHSLTNLSVEQVSQLTEDESVRLAIQKSLEGVDHDEDEEIKRALEESLREDEHGSSSNNNPTSSDLSTLSDEIEHDISDNSRLPTNMEDMILDFGGVDDKNKDNNASSVSMPPPLPASSVVKKAEQGHRDSEYEYRLVAVVSHVGPEATINSGHYVADVFSVSRRQWFHYNDMTVKKSSFEEVSKNNSHDGYLFFYARAKLL